MILKQVKDMPGRCLHHTRTIGQNHGLKDIDHLRDTSHSDTVRVLVENVQRQGRNQCISHGILLIEEARVCTRLHIEPVAPFVDDHADLFIRIILIHDRTVSLDQLFHFICLGESLIPLSLVKLRGASLMLPGPGDGVVMKRKTVCVSVEPFLALAEQGLQ